MRAIVRVCGRRLLVFHVSDTHVHVVVLSDRAVAGRLAQALGLALAAVFCAPLPAAGITPIDDAAHLRSTFVYVLRNDERHGVVPDPWRENSNLPDLLGARVTALSTAAATRGVLPRIDAAFLRELAGWELPQLRRAFEPALVREHLRDSAAAIVAAADLVSRRPQVVAARIAAVHIGLTAGIPEAELGAILGVDPKTIRRRSRVIPAENLLRALERQLEVRSLAPRPPEQSFAEEAPRPVWGRRTPSGG